MDPKTLQTLEFPKILERLAGYCAFAASQDLALALQPCRDLEAARQRQAQTGEALRLLSTQPDLSIGGARDIRQSVDLARRGGVLDPGDLLDVKYTLIAARNLTRTFERLGEQFPNLYAITAQEPPPPGVVDAITRAISDRGEILDQASERLASIRRDLSITHDRLLSKLQRIVGDPRNTPYLQEALITQRDGRYVLPLRAEFKGRIKSIVHDQSSSGATLFVEPLSVVEQNNAYRELLLAERDEERRILGELSALIGSQASVITRTIAWVAELDLVFARAKYADDLAATEPELYPIPAQRPGNHPGTIIRLYQARHPLLDPATVTAIDIELDSQTYALVITGPNTGGKTVSLKTVGLLALMAQAGLHIPADRGSGISFFQAIYADIGDEQSIEQSLSTFSGHITNIIRILAAADRRALVILDELGAGTDPQEGAALARALLTHLLERGITTLVTTHHPELKAFAHATPGVVNASVEFDLETLRPTYHLTIGLPGRSNALAIAERLGMPGEIIAAGRAEIDPTDLRAEDLLDEIHRQRDLSRQARAAAENARHEAETLRSQLAERLDKIADESREILENARLEASEQLEAVQGELRRLRRELARARQPLEALKQVETELAELQVEASQPVARPAPAQDELLRVRPVRLGDKVRLKSLNTQGVVTSLGEEEAEVQVGMLRIRTRLDELQLARQEAPDAPPKKARSSAALPAEKPSSPAPAPSPGIELDLRGQRADDASDALERYLDAAYLAGLPFVRIIHGKGTGKLRNVVREALSNHPHVRAFEPGSQQEGGEGVTVAKLRNN